MSIVVFLYGMMFICPGRLQNRSLAATRQASDRSGSSDGETGDAEPSEDKNDRSALPRNRPHKMKFSVREHCRRIQTCGVVQTQVVCVYIYVWAFANWTCLAEADGLVVSCPSPLSSPVYPLVPLEQNASTESTTATFGKVAENSLELSRLDTHSNHFVNS